MPLGDLFGGSAASETTAADAPTSTAGDAQISAATKTTDSEASAPTPAGGSGNAVNVETSGGVPVSTIGSSQVQQECSANGVTSDQCVGSAKQWSSLHIGLLAGGSECCPILLALRSALSFPTSPSLAPHTFHPPPALSHPG